MKVARILLFGTQFASKDRNFGLGSFMKLSLEHKMWLGIGLGFAFLLLASVAAYWNSTYSLISFKWVEYTQRVLDDLNSTRAAILDVETGARGFVITGNGDFLQPFNRGRERVGALIQTLKRETSDNPHIPVVMITSSREEQDLVKSYELGVNTYVVKPVDFQKFVESVRQLGFFWVLVNEPPPGGGSHKL
ncbi:MAG: hypothetical protein QOD03_1404 [Verrucomicrobiota bacterium]